MSSIEKFVVAPENVWNRLAKYSPEVVALESLIDADVKKDKIITGNFDPMTKKIAYKINQPRLNMSRQKIFGKKSRNMPNTDTSIPKDSGSHDVKQPISESVQNDDEDNISEFQSVKDENEQVDEVTSDENDENIQHEKEEQSPSDTIQKEDSTQQEADVIVDSQNDALDDTRIADLEHEEEGMEDDLNISQASLAKIKAIKQAKQIIDKQVPRKHLWFDADGMVYIEGEPIKKSIDAILNFLYTPDSNYVAGSGTVLYNMLRVPGFNPKITNKKAIEYYISKFGEERPPEFKEKGGSLSKLILIKKLPCNLK